MLETFIENNDISEFCKEIPVSKVISPKITFEMVAFVNKISKKVVGRIISENEIDEINKIQIELNKKNELSPFDKPIF